MTSTEVVVLIWLSLLFVAVLVGLVHLAKVRRDLRKELQEKQKPRPCYRCAAVASTEYMGLHYCFWCREAIIMVPPVVKQDPPFGFPGAPGYTEFPEHLVEEEQK